MIGAPVLIDVAHPEGPVELRAFLSATPGLVVHESLGDPGWIITHARSGLAVSMVDDPEQAQALAAMLGQVCDWTQSGDVIRAIEPPTGDVVRMIEAEFGAHFMSMTDTLAQPVECARRRSL